MSITIRPSTACIAAAIAFVCILPVHAVTFTTNPNGTATDTSTGLVWDKCTYGLTGSACAGGAAQALDWPSALSAATSANAANYKGFSDWRLPNIKELESIVELGTSSPSINFGAFPATPSGAFWSSTSLAASFVWLVDFLNGGFGVSSTEATNYVRLVRSGQSLAALDALSAPNRTATGPTATASGNQTMSFTPTGNSNALCSLASTSWVAATSTAPSLPTGVTFPHGLLRFATNNCGNGTTLNITVTLPSAVAAGTPYYKYGKTAADPTPHWYTIPATLNSAGTQYTFSITDGQLGDDDMQVNGVISDDGGPGVGGGAGAGPGGVASVPTLGEWALLLLASLMGLLGMRAARRR